MHPTRFLILAVAVGVALPSAAVQAADPFEDYDTSNQEGLAVSIKAHLGLGSAVGATGLTVSLIPIRWFEIEAGLGWGSFGAQLSLMPKLRLGNRTHSYVAGAGLSGGFPLDELTKDVHAGPSLWLNADLAGYEYRMANGFTLLVAGGLSYCLYGDTIHPPSLADQKDEPDPVLKGTLIGQFRIGFGYTF